MDQYITRLLALLAIFISSFFMSQDALHAQVMNAVADSTDQKVVVIKNDGSRFIGTIIARDEREILIETETLGRIYIPLHEIREIRSMRVGENAGYSVFSTRYFLTTNGLSVSKGDKYALLSYYGPEAHFGVANDFTLGAMTTWAGVPLIGSAKYSFHFDENVHMSLGVLAGTLSWINIRAAGIMGYGAFTIGNYDNNFTISAGYAGVTYEGDGGNAPLMSLACLFKLGKNVHFVGDSFIYLGESPFTIIVPGLRFDRPARRSSIQAGLGGIIIEGEGIPVPIPIFSWFYEL